MMTLAMQTSLFIILALAELGVVIENVMSRRGDGDASSLMQLGAARMGGRKSNEDVPDSNRLFWRPRKSLKTSRRRRMMRSRWSLENDFAELAANAGPGHNEANRNTRLIQNQVRRMLGQRVEIDDRTGVSRNESNNMQAAMAA